MSSLSNYDVTRIRKLWSTGQVSRLIGVNVKTVASWVDNGEIKGVKLPGSPERRIHRDELRRFLSRHDCDWALKEMDEEEGSAPPAPPDRRRRPRAGG